MKKQLIYLLCCIFIGMTATSMAQSLTHVDLRLPLVRWQPGVRWPARWELLVPEGFTGNLADYYLHLIDNKGNTVALPLDQVQQHGISFDRTQLFTGEHKWNLASHHPGLETDFEYGLYGLVRVYFLPEGATTKAYPPKHDLASVFYQVPAHDGWADVAGVKLFGFARNCMIAYGGTLEERKTYNSRSEIRNLSNFAEGIHRLSGGKENHRNAKDDTTSPDDGFVWVCLRANADPVPTPSIIRLPLKDDCYRMLLPLPTARTIDDYIAATNFLYAKPLLSPDILPLRKDVTLAQLDKLAQLQDHFQRYNTGNLLPDASWNFTFIEIPKHPGLLLGMELFEYYLTLIDPVTPDGTRLATQLQADIDRIRKATTDTELYYRRANDSTLAMYAARGKPINRPDLPIRNVKFGETPAP